MKFPKMAPLPPITPPTCPVCQKPVDLYAAGIYIPEGLGEGLTLHSFCGAKTFVAYEVAPEGSSPCIFPTRELADEEKAALEQDEGLEDPVTITTRLMMWRDYYRLPEHSGY